MGQDAMMNRSTVGFPAPVHLGSTHRHAICWGLMSTSGGPVPALDADLIERLRSDLVTADWTAARLGELLSADAAAALSREQRIPALVELEGSDDPAATLTRFFMLGSVEEAPRLDVALTTLTSMGLVALGLAQPLDGEEASSDEGDAPSRMRALVDLRPHAAAVGDEDADTTWWIASDQGEAITGRPLASDHVMGVGGASASLLRATMRRRVARALDLGCGCGIQALALATHADHVVATDLSARACAFTTFNAALNSVSLDVRQGSLFEPVEGENFDLIVSNPPFVITPDSVRSSRGTGMLEYRDAGMNRDRLVEIIIRTAPAMLAPGGCLQMLANWEIPEGVDPDFEWSQRIDEWFDGLPVDAWVVQRDVLDPARYVEMWTRDSGVGLVGRDAYERTYRTWLADFRAAGVGAIGMGLITMRTPAVAEGATGEDNGVRVYDYAITGIAPRGLDVERALAALRLPNDLWDSRLIRADDVIEERHYVPGSADPTVLILHQGAGLGKSIVVSSATAAVVGASDGELTVGQIASAVAMLTDRRVDEVKEEVVPALRDLLRAGMVSIAVGESGSRCA